MLTTGTPGVSGGLSPTNLGTLRTSHGAQVRYDGTPLYLFGFEGITLTATGFAATGNGNGISVNGAPSRSSPLDPTEFQPWHRQRCQGGSPATAGDATLRRELSVSRRGSDMRRYLAGLRTAVLTVAAASAAAAPVDASRAIVGNSTDTGTGVPIVLASCD